MKQILLMSATALTLSFAAYGMDQSLATSEKSEIRLKFDRMTDTELAIVNFEHVLFHNSRSQNQMRYAVNTLIFYNAATLYGTGSFVKANDSEALMASAIKENNDLNAQLSDAFLAIAKTNYSEMPSTLKKCFNSLKPLLPEQDQRALSYGLTIGK